MSSQAIPSSNTVVNSNVASGAGAVIIPGTYLLAGVVGVNGSARSWAMFKAAGVAGPVDADIRSVLKPES